MRDRDKAHQYWAPPHPPDTPSARCDVSVLSTEPRITGLCCLARSRPPRCRYGHLATPRSGKLRRPPCQRRRDSRRAARCAPCLQPACWRRICNAIWVLRSWRDNDGDFGVPLAQFSEYGKSISVGQIEIEQNKLDISVFCNELHRLHTVSSSNRVDRLSNRERCRATPRVLRNDRRPPGFHNDLAVYPESAEPAACGCGPRSPLWRPLQTARCA